MLVSIYNTLGFIAPNYAKASGKAKAAHECLGRVPLLSLLEFGRMAVKYAHTFCCHWVNSTTSYSRSPADCPSLAHLYINPGLVRLGKRTAGMNDLTAVASQAAGMLDISQILSEQERVGADAQTHTCRVGRPDFS